MKGEIYMSEESLYSIQFVSNVTGINPHTIRAWEKRYGATKPIRDKNGRRLYSDEEIRRLEALHKLVNLGTSISDIANLSEGELNSVLSKYTVVDINIRSKKETISTRACLDSLLMSLNFFKLDVLSHELDKAEQSLNTNQFIHEIVIPLLSEIRRYKGKKLFTQDQIEQVNLVVKAFLNKKMYHLDTSESHNGKRVLVSAAFGPLNELGAMVAAIILLGKRYDVQFLGGNVSAGSLAALANQFSPDFIFTGLNYSHDLTYSSIQKEDYLAKLSDLLVVNPKILVGAFDYCLNSSSSNIKCFDDFNTLDQFLVAA